MSKYQLTQIIESLNKEEIRSYKLYAQRINMGDGDIKTIRLFDLIKNGADEFDTAVVKELFEEENMNAYYRLKNRLIGDIEQSLLMIHRGKDERFTIYKLIELANVFRYKSNYATAYSYLSKAERKAIKAEHLDLLNVIYDEISALTKDYYKIDPEKYIKKKKDNLVQHEKKLQADYLLASVTHKLVNNNYNFKNTNINQELEEIQQKLSLDPDVAKSKDIQFSIDQIIRTNLLQQKDFVSLEAYLIKTYTDFKERKMYGQQYFENVFAILNWIINVSTVNKKFEQSLQFAEELNRNLSKFNKKFYHKYLWMYHQSSIINSSFLGKNERAMEILKEIKANPKFEGTNFYDVFIDLNLALSYYNIGEVDQALKTISTILQPEGYKELTKSLQFSISIVNLILHYENGDEPYVVNLVQEMRREFRKELKEPQYKREKELLGFLRAMSASAEGIKGKRLREQIKAFIKNSPQFEPGSNEAINYRLWLQSVLDKSSYYELVLSAVGSPIPDK